MLKALIAYGTQYGSTARIAREMAAVLEREQYEVQMVDLGKERLHDVSEYDLVIVGSAIKMDKWTNETLDFLKAHERELSAKRIALFVSCASARQPPLKALGRSREEAEGLYLRKVAERYPSMSPVALGFFGGCFDFGGDHGLFYRLATQNMFKEQLRAEGVDTNKSYDFRDWTSMREWTAEVAKAGRV